MLANNLKNLRKKYNLTQEEFGKLFNVDRSTVSKWEREISSPDIFLASEIAKFFGISVEALTGESEHTVSNDLNVIKKNVHKSQLLSRKNKSVFIVPIINIALLLSMITSLLIILVPTYKHNNYQDNDYKLVYSNIETVSLQIFVPNEKIIVKQLDKSIHLTNVKYTIKNVNVFVCDNPAKIEELYTRISIIVLLKSGFTINLPRANKLMLCEDNKSLKQSSIKVYPYFENTGVYDLEFYIENDMGYIGAYMSK